MAISLVFQRISFRDPAAIRTRDRLLRRQMLCPTELPDPLKDADDLSRLHLYVISPD